MEEMILNNPCRKGGLLDQAVCDFCHAVGSGFAAVAVFDTKGTEGVRSVLFSQCI